MSVYKHSSSNSPWFQQGSRCRFDEPCRVPFFPFHPDHCCNSFLSIDLPAVGETVTDYSSMIDFGHGLCGSHYDINILDNWTCGLDMFELKAWGHCHIIIGLWLYDILILSADQKFSSLSLSLQSAGHLERSVLWSAKADRGSQI